MDLNMNERKSGLHGRSSTSVNSTGNKSFKRLFARFAEKTSMQGVFYIYSAKNRGQKIFWICLLIACTVGMGSHLYYLINQFTKYPVNTKIELGFSNLKFPAVTICNVNPIRRSKLYIASQELQDMVEHLTQVGYGDYVDAHYDIYDIDYDFGEIVDDRIWKLEEFRRLYKKEKRETKIELGHQIEDMLISCTVGKFKCFASNFTVLPHHIYGNCFTLQTGDMKITKAGPSNGLSLILYMDRNEYLKQISEGFGARVQVHDIGTFPFPDEEGIFVPSASETQIGLRMVTIERLGGLYGNCSGDRNYSRIYGYKYTRYLCQILCSNDWIFHTCDCHAPDVKDVSPLVNKFCTNKSEKECMHKELIRQNKNKGDCKCWNPCSENQFLKTISHRNWPSEDYLTILINESVCSRIPQKCIDATLLYMGKDLSTKSLDYVKVDIFYEDLNYERIVETPEIENAQFMSDFGGAVGLWIGFSVLSFFELVQLITECVRIACCPNCCRN
ncbi:degenerin-like protein unc-105 [Mytilus californianus]|uniref:degenerin-like protein unc-105 n=1 Tax=Mytilus californianus TaxID=6549 RepID=UPI00224542FF|nr:degenerin-like protein unc-105 [Mytilus californianus]